MAGGDPHELSIRVQVLGGQWETIGADRYRGVVAENFQAQADQWGPSSCSFTLRRDPAAVHPDLIAWTPVEVWIAGVLVWDGRVKETPAQEGADFSLNVQCEGWQYHLDDDVYSKSYVRTRLADWVDERSIAVADLTVYRIGATAATGGTISLGWPNGAEVLGSAGVMLDMGPNSTAQRIVVTWTYNDEASVAAINFIARASNTPSESQAGATTSDAFNLNVDALTGATTAGTFTSPQRYVHLLLNRATAFTATKNYTLNITSVQVFASTAYESGNASILTADQIVKDALTQATVLLSSNASDIKAGTFSIPEFTISDYQTPRDAITAANAYENYETKLLPGRRLAFRPRASTPIYEIGEWSGADFADASTNSGDDIFNKTIVQGTGPDSGPLNVLGSLAPALSQRTVSIPLTNPAPTNPSFDTNTTGWTAFQDSGTPTVARDTTAGEFDTSPASGRFTEGGLPLVGYALGTMTGTFLAGVTYELSLRLALTAGGGGSNGTAIVFGPTSVIDTHGQASVLIPAGGDFGYGYFAPPTKPTFATAKVRWTPQSTTATAAVRLELIPSAIGDLLVDSLSLAQLAGGLPGRWGFLRSTVIPVQAGLTAVSAARLAQLYLTAHKTTPFRGSFNTLPGGVRSVKGGSSPHPAWLLRDTGQLVRVAKVDPDTGAWGRTGTIAAVSYDHDSLTSNISLDENRAGFQTLLSRLDIVAGQRQ